MKKTEERSMTKAEALADGYVYYCSEDGESFGNIEDLSAPEYFEGVEFYLSQKEPFKFSLSPDTIRELIENHLGDQDEVYDEDMNDLLDDVDFQKVADLINPCFTKKYYMPSDIRLYP